MSLTGSEVRDSFEEALKYGQLIRLKYYNISYGAGSYYDDDVTLTQSGTDNWISGLVQPIDASRGSYEASLVEQGKLLNNDSKVYILGNIVTSGTLKVGLGSPPTSEYSVLNDGIISWNINGEQVIKKMYLRYLTNGSLMGE